MPHSLSEHHGPSPLERLLSLVRAERKDLMVIVVYSAAIGLLTLAAPVAVQSLVNTVAFGTVLQPLVVLTILLAVALAASAILQCFRAVGVEIVQRRVFVRLAAHVSDVLLRVQTAAYDKQHVPELVNRFLDVVTVQKAFAVLLVDGLTVAMQTLIGLFLLALYHPYLLAFDAALLALMLLILFVGGRGAVRTAIAESRSKYDVLAWLEEMARHQVAFRSAPGSRFAMDRANALVTEWLGARASHFRILLRQIAGALGLQALAMATLLGAGGWLVIQGELTLGQLVAAELVVSLIVSGFSKFGKSLESFYDLQAAMDKLGHLIDLPVEPVAQEPVAVRPGPARITLHDLRFAYDESRELVAGAKMDLAPGARLALFARSGQGKSTVLDLFAGFRTPTGGALEFNRVDYRDHGAAAIRDHVALVRDVEIFQGTLLENIRLGSEASLNEVREAIQQVGLEEAVLSLPEGLNTMLMPGGSPLSRSQALRVMVARALLRQPGVLLLDEVLDHLDDFDHQGTLARTLFGAGRPWTLIIATEEPEIAAHCDRVLTLGGGRLLERLPSEVAGVLALRGGAA